MIILHRKIFAASIAAIFLLFVIHFSFRPLSNDGLRSFVGGSTGKPYKDVKEPFREYQEYQEGPPTTTSSEIESEPTTTESHRLVASETPEAILPDKILVIAKTSAEDTNWVHDHFPDWQSAIYTVDDPAASLHTTTNKGREANAYLTYLIHHYSNLPSTMLFLHSHRNHDHGSRDAEPDLNLDFDNVATIRAFKTGFVQRAGYANLRCISGPGCPAEIQPFRPVEQSDPLRPQERAMASVWPKLFGNATAVPRVIATPCCAQFAVSRAQVEKRPKGDYERFLGWLEETPLDDYTSGRVFEYLWHVIFGREPVYCPDEVQCYREQFGSAPPPRKPKEGEAKEDESKDEEPKEGKAEDDVSDKDDSTKNDESRSH